MKAFARAAWGYTRPYFVGASGFAPAALLVAVIACQLGFVAAEVAKNQWRNDFFQSLQDRNWDAFVHQFWVYLAIAASLIVTAVYQTYFTQWLTMRWRHWLTSRFLDRWLAGHAHYRIGLMEQRGDNPDQRIAEDTEKFAASALSITVGLLGAVVTLFSFVAILWNISSSVRIGIGGESYVIPGLLVWAALVYSLAGTILAHLIGRALVPLNYQHDRVEGSFRFALARVRDNTEEIALLGGEQAERRELDRRFGDVLQNWFALIRRQKLLGFFAESFKHASLYFPYLMLAPLYFAGELQFGLLMQAGSAFATVRASLSFFVTAYRELSEWMAVTQRLSGLDQDLQRVQGFEHAASADAAIPGASTFAVRDLKVWNPARGEIIGRLDRLDLDGGDTHVLRGKSGSGKTSVIRTLARLWPFMEGTVQATPAARTMALPQRSYMPLGTLKDSLVYPQSADDVSDEAASAALHDVGLGRLSAKLHERGVIDTLSGGERQRVGFARVLIARPDLILLDEPTSGLEPDAHDDLFGILRRRLPNAVVIATSTDTETSPAS